MADFFGKIVHLNPDDMHVMIVHIITGKHFILTFVPFAVSLFTIEERSTIVAQNETNKTKIEAKNYFLEEMERISSLILKLLYFLYFSGVIAMVRIAGPKD